MDHNRKRDGLASKIVSGTSISIQDGRRPSTIHAMPHINEGPGEHDPTVSAYIIRTDFDEPKIMLHKHRKIGKWLQFGGHIEKQETPWQAISHEVPEETGYAMSQLQILQPADRFKTTASNIIHPVPAYDITHPFPGLDHYHNDRGYVFVADQEPQGDIDERESHDIGLFTLAEIEHLEDIIPDVRDVSRYVLEVCLAKWEPLPISTFAV
jgi:8-oxo-dGTP pyrophosphatase MutT (NUDIX family)